MSWQTEYKEPCEKAGAVKHMKFGDVCSPGRGICCEENCPSINYWSENHRQPHELLLQKLQEEAQSRLENIGLKDQYEAEIENG